MGRKTKYDRVGRPSENPPIKIWWKEDGKKVEFKETFKTITDAASKVDGDIAAIHKCLNGIRDTHKGYHYEFTDPEYHKEEIQNTLSNRMNKKRWSSRYPGIYYEKDGKWHAYLFNGSTSRKLLLGKYDTEQEAIDRQEQECRDFGLDWPLGELHPY